MLSSGRFAVDEQVRTGESERAYLLPCAEDERSSLVVTTADYRADLGAVVRRSH